MLFRILNYAPTGAKRKIMLKLSKAQQLTLLRQVSNETLLRIRACSGDSNPQVIEMLTKNEGYKMAIDDVIAMLAHDDTRELGIFSTF